MKSDDELLDKIAAHLRSEPVPPMPALPVLRAAKRTRDRRWLLLAAAAAALAASLGAVLWWRPLPPPGPGLRAPDVAENVHPVPADSGVVVLEADLSHPLTQIETGLDAIDDELAALRREAALLDARREADRLLAQL